MSVATVVNAGATYTYTFYQDTNPSATNSLKTLVEQTIIFKTDDHGRRLAKSIDGAVTLQLQKSVKYPSLDQGSRLVYESIGKLSLSAWKQPELLMRYGTTSYRTDYPSGLHRAYGVLRVYNAADKDDIDPVDIIYYQLVIMPDQDSLLFC